VESVCACGQQLGMFDKGSLTPSVVGRAGHIFPVAI